MQITDHAVANAEHKLTEAAFFLAWMDTVESGRQVVSSIADAKIGYGYYLSAFLNACYSVIEQLKQSRVQEHRQAAHDFKKAHPGFYGRGTGLRSRATHIHPVNPQHEGYLPPPGDVLLFRFHGKDFYRPPAGDALDFDSSQAGRYYFDACSPQNTIGDICSIHLGELRELVRRCRVQAPI